LTNAALDDDFDAAPASAPQWVAYVRRLAGEKTTQKAISDHTGVDQSTVNRWFMRHQPPSVRAVIQVAHAYGVNPVDALIVAGYLQEGDIDLPPAPTVSPRDFPTPDLINEISRRAAERT
jgi:transcriptional regulator with XRE-family HTH domain